MGLGVGIYVLAISISGSAIVYRPQLTRMFSRKTVVKAEPGHRMTLQELAQRAERAYPTYEVDNIREAQTPDAPDDIVLERAHKRIERFFDPYTGSDLGDAHSAIEHILGWLLDLHDNLLAGQTGRLVNGVGSCFVTLLSLTGAILWWPGIKNWQRHSPLESTLPQAQLGLAQRNRLLVLKLFAGLGSFGNLLLFSGSLQSLD
jgi:uncharacterized iron-regulated membrane protein